MRRTRNIVAVALTLVWIAPLAAAAHEGHEHVVMGIVQKFDGKSVEVKTRDEKTKAEKVVIVVLNEKTEVMRGDRKADLADIRIGERIVIRAVTSKDASGKDIYTGKQVRLGGTTAGA